MELIDSQKSNQGANGTLRNEVTTIVLGILSIIGCFFFGVPGIIFGVIGIALHSKDKRLYLSDSSYYQKSYSNAKAGLVCAIIGLILGILFIGSVMLLAFSAASWIR